MKNILFSLVFVLLALGMLVVSDVLAQEKNVQLFINGAIYIDADNKVNNLLVEDGIVRAFNIEPAKYPNAVVIDLKGAAAYPGFNDSHIHMMETGVSFYLGANLIGCNSVDDIVKILEEKAKTVPEGGLLIGGGFFLPDYDKWTLEDLAKIDKVTGNRIAFLFDKLGHDAVINTAAMKFCGITPETPVPLGGKMIMENGKLTGMLRESAMTLPGNKILAIPSDNDVKAGTLLLAKQWASLGYTGIVDLMGGPGIRIMHPQLFKELEKEEQLPLRVNYCYTIFNLKDVDDALKYKNQDTDLVRFLGCKIFVDGAYAGGQSWTSWVNNRGNHGLQEIYTDDIGGPELNLNRIVAKVEEYGMNIHYHTTGDQAINAVLDALDKVVAEKGNLKGIHTLIHCTFITDEQIDRIKKFNGRVVTTIQPGFLEIEKDESKSNYGDRVKETFRYKKMFDSGLSIGISTDFSVSPPEYTLPMVIMRSAVTGGGDPQTYPPVSIRDMIKGFTEGSAKTTGKDDAGTLSIGKKADIVVFDQDLYSVPPEKFNKDNPKVLATYISGRKVYEGK